MQYETLKIEVIAFANADVVTASGDTDTPET